MMSIRDEMQAKFIPQQTTGNLRDRAFQIEKMVCEKYLDEDTDAADVALDELHRDSNRTDEDIAYQVALRISCP